jgi:hypothetical protein
MLARTLAARRDDLRDNIATLERDLACSVRRSLGLALRVRMNVNVGGAGAAFSR